MATATRKVSSMELKLHGIIVSLKFAGDEGEKKIEEVTEKIRVLCHGKEGFDCQNTKSASQSIALSDF